MIDDRMKWWTAVYARHPSVVKWLRENPPPVKWQGTPMEWAYTEMPATFLGLKDQ